MRINARRWVPSIALLAVLLTVGSARTTWSEEQPDAKVAPRTFALLIGCNEYPELKKTVPPARYEARIRLAGCVNDVELMRKTLMESMEVPAAHITTLAGWDADDAATRPSGANIRAALEALAKRTYKPGDRVIVHYSGHGVQQADENGDEADGLDEAWLVADATKDKKRGFAGTLRDEEIGAYLAAIRARGASVWCLMDCCHSATGTRGADDEPVRTRGFDPAVLDIEVVPAATRGATDPHETSPMALLGKDAAGLCVFYAAQSYQEVPEVRLPKDGAERKSYGLLTTAVVRALSHAGPGLTYGELYEHVVAAYRDLGHQHTVQPYAEGDLAGRVFGSGRALGVSLVVRKTGPRKLELNAGALHGLVEGTELDVFPLGHAGGDDGKLGRVRVNRVGPATSALRPAEGDNGTWVRDGSGTWSARIARFVVGDRSLPLELVDARGRKVEQDVAAEDVRSVLESTVTKARFPPASDAQPAAWQLELDGDGRPVALRPARRGGPAPRFAVNADTLEGTLLSVYRAESLLRLTGRDPGMGRLPRNLRLQVHVREPGGNSRLLSSGGRVVPGSFLDIGLIKEEATAGSHAETVDVYVFWIDPHYGIYKLYPNDTGGPRLAENALSSAEKPIRVGQPGGEGISDVSQGLERLVVFAAPKRSDAGRLQLDFLEQSPLKRVRGVGSGKHEGVEDFLYDLAFGEPKTRGRLTPVKRVSQNLAMRVYTFETRWNAIRIPMPVEGRPRTRLYSKPVAPVAPGQPSAWALGRDVHLAPAGRDGPWCLLVGQALEAAHVLIDLDGEVDKARRTPKGLQTLVATRSFDAEIALRIESEPRRALAWYDRDDDGTFDLLLVDRDGDHRADMRYVRSGDGWGKPADVDIELLSTGHLPGIEGRAARTRSLQRLGAIAGGGG